MGLAFCASLLALAGIEVAVRLLDVAPRPLAPLPIPSYRLSENPVIGYEYRPDYQPEDQPFDASHEGYAINNQGFRDVEYELDKPPGTYRVVVLGDSTTAGNGVRDLDSTYTKLLERSLNAESQSSLRYEVMNMAVGGYHTMQEVETLRVKGLQYEPDLVLVTFCLNDFKLHSDGGVYRRLKEINLLSPPRPLSGAYRRLLRTSRLAFVLHHRLNSSNTDYDEWYRKKVLEGRSTVRAGLTLLSQLQQREGFSALVVILPEFRAPFVEYRSRETHAEVFREASGLLGVSVLDLLEAFSSLREDASELSYDGAVHMNETGHERMAEILLPVVREISLSATPSTGPEAEVRRSQ